MPSIAPLAHAGGYFREIDCMHRFLSPFLCLFLSLFSTFQYDVLQDGIDLAPCRLWSEHVHRYIDWHLWQCLYDEEICWVRQEIMKTKAISTGLYYRFQNLVLHLLFSPQFTCSYYAPNPIVCYDFNRLTLGSNIPIQSIYPCLSAQSVRKPFLKKLEYSLSHASSARG